MENPTYQDGCATASPVPVSPVAPVEGEVEGDQNRWGQALENGAVSGEETVVEAASAPASQPGPLGYASPQGNGVPQGAPAYAGPQSADNKKGPKEDDGHDCSEHTAVPGPQYAPQYPAPGMFPGYAPQFAYGPQPGAMPAPMPAPGPQTMYGPQFAYGQPMPAPTPVPMPAPGPQAMYGPQFAYGQPMPVPAPPFYGPIPVPQPGMQAMYGPQPNGAPTHAPQASNGAPAPQPHTPQPQPNGVPAQAKTPQPQPHAPQPQPNAPQPQPNAGPVNGESAEAHEEKKGGKKGGKEKDDGHVCNCGSHAEAAPQAPFMAQEPQFGGLPYPFSGMFGPQFGFGPQPGPQPAAPQPGFGPQAQPGFVPPFGQPVPQPMPQAAQYGPMPQPENENMGGFGAPAGFAGFPGFGGAPGFGAPAAARYGAVDPQDLANRYGQIVEMCNDLMQGKADPMKIATFLASSGTHFWKGAVVGAAMTFLMTNDGVKSALGESFSGIFGSKAATE